MNNIDRFLRVIYTKADIGRLMNIDRGDVFPGMKANGTSRSSRTQDFWLSRGGATPSPYTERIIGRYLVCYPKNYSKEEVGLLLDRQLAKANGDLGSEMVNALDLIHLAARSLLELKGGRLFVRHGLLLEWNGVANRIDPNVLFAAYDESRGLGGHRGHVSVHHGDRRLGDILAKGLAENHVHLKGAGYSAEMNWYCLLHLSDCRPACLREALAKLLDTTWLHPEVEKEQLILAYAKIPILRNLLYLYARKEDAEWHAAADRQWTDCCVSEMILQLLCIRDEIGLDALLRKHDFRLVNDAFSREYGNPLLENPAEYFYFEQRFLRTMLRVIRRRSAERVDPLVLYGFNVYIAAVTQFKLWLQHDNLLMGFSRFSAAEREKEFLIDYVSGGREMLYRSVFDRYYRSDGVLSVELRIPPKTIREYTKLVRELDSANNAAFLDQLVGHPHRRKIQYRLVMHFIKDGKPASTMDHVARKEPMLNDAAKGIRKILKIFELRGKTHGLAEKISAIDTANFEINTRPEVYGQTYRRFRQEVACSNDVTLTYHVGEDFPSLVNGLRAIDEAITFLELDEGDRLGHATAVGLDVDDFFRRKRNYVLSTLQDYVDDIAWLWSLFREDGGGSPEMMLFLTQEYEKYASKLFSDAFLLRHQSEKSVSVPTISDYMAAHELRGNDPYLYVDSRIGGVGDPGEARRRVDTEAVRLADENINARQLYARYHFDGALKTAGAQSLIIPVCKSYVGAVKMAQSCVRKRIHDLGISIETNPTSNKKISSVERFIELPLLRLNSHGLSGVPGMSGVEEENIALTINSDDPAVFQTDLEMEYALVVEALRRAGYDHEEVYSYIDYLRELSLIQAHRQCEPA